MADFRLHIRLLPSADDAIRDFVRKRGDLGRRVLEMLETIDLTTVKLPNMDGATKTAVAGSYTSVDIPTTEHKRLMRLSIERECTMNQLVNGGILAYAARLRKQKRS
jgi:hypothetical protein